MTHFLLESEPGVHFEAILRHKGDDAFDHEMAAGGMDEED